MEKMQGCISFDTLSETFLRKLQIELELARHQSDCQRIVHTLCFDIKPLW